MKIQFLYNYNSLLASTALTCIGFLVATFGIATGFSNYCFVKKAISTEGIVINNLQDTTQSSQSYYPLVRFTTRTGETVVFESKVGSRYPEYKKGDRIDVLYHSQKPDAAMMNTWISLWFFPIIFSATGSITTLLGTALLAQNLKQSKLLAVNSDQ